LENLKFVGKIMASIIKRETKSGVSYRIQVFVKNIGSGKNEVKTITWKPPADATRGEATRLLTSLRWSLKSNAARKAGLKTLWRATI
jgi:hypothetical protein